MNNDVFPNKFKAALAAKQVQIGGDAANLLI